MSNKNFMILYKQSFSPSDNDGGCRSGELDASAKAITNTAAITIAKIHAPAMSRNAQVLGVFVTEMSFGAFVSGRAVRLLDLVSWTKIIGIKTEINKHYRLGG